LRGPQGTLFGKNVVGGAVNMITRKPTEETVMQVEATLGDYNARTLRGLVSGELISAAQLLAAAHDLPAEFIAALAGPPESWSWPENPERFEQWTAPDGSLWVWDQPRAADGTYLADDPATPEQESELQWLPVEVQP